MRFLFIFFIFFSFSAKPTKPRTHYDESPLHEAAYFGDIEEVKKLVKQGKIDINEVGKKSGNTPLHWAVNTRKTFNRRTKIRLNTTFKPFSKKKYLKIIENYLKTIEFLIERGAEVNVKNTKGNTPLHIVIRKQSREIDQPQRNINPNVQNYIKTQSIKIAQLLIKKGANPNIKNNKGKTPLHLTRQLKTAKLLIESEADVNAKDDNGRTFLHIILFWIHSTEKIAKLLIENGADVNVRSNRGRTPLHYSARKGLWDMSKFFIEAGADVNARDNKGQAPLHDAIEVKSWEISKLLIEKEANVNTKDNEGISPLHKSIFFNI